MQALIIREDGRRHYTEKRDILTTVYPHLDFTRAIVTGSYALNQFTGDAAWEPNDVDIITTATEIDHFKTMVQWFCASTGGTMIKFSDFAEGHPDRRPEEDRRDEKFHEAIRASAKVQVPGIDIILQFVWISSFGSDAPAEVQLEQVSDLPSCVSYKVINGRKFFVIPEKGREALFTRRVSMGEICPARREKYEERMYEFY